MSAIVGPPSNVIGSSNVIVSSVLVIDIDFTVPSTCPVDVSRTSPLSSFNPAPALAHAPLSTFIDETEPSALKAPSTSIPE